MTFTGECAQGRVGARAHTRARVTNFVVRNVRKLKGQPVTSTTSTTPTTQHKPMRDLMPTVAAWIDAMRAAFGKDVIDQALRDPAFHASENGHTIGTPMRWSAEFRRAE
jgi:hypothetical protein